MFIRNTALALTLAVAAISAAFAGGGYERPFESSPASGVKSRSDIKKELEAFRKNPADAGGGFFSNRDGRDARFIEPQHSYGFENGSFVHTDKLPHDTPKPELSPLTDEQRSLYRSR